MIKRNGVIKCVQRYGVDMRRIYRRNSKHFKANGFYFNIENIKIQ